MRSILYELSFAALCLPFFAGCAPEQIKESEKVIQMHDGPVVLEDKKFGIYYGDRYNNGLSVFYIVLSDARCYINGLSDPYMDSDGDMLVLELYAPSGNETVPDGVYDCSGSARAMSFNAGSSYVIRFDGSIQTRWEIVEGKISFSSDENGVYDIYTDGFVIEKSSVRMGVEYTANTVLFLQDYMAIAPGLFGPDDDIVDLPFYEVECSYYGNLYESATGNYVLQMMTKGIMEDETGNLPGMLLVMNCFGKLYNSKVDPVLTEGEYLVSTTSGSLFQFNTLLPGMDYDGSPFGTYMYQQSEDSDMVLNYAASGSLDVSYDENGLCTLEVDIVTSSSRRISGKWTGELVIDNNAESSGGVILSTLLEDVECDMSKVETGRLAPIEVLHRDNDIPEKDYDIAEAWQLYLQPRDWTDEEKENHTWDEMLDIWTPDGDVMILEFILPLGSGGDIAPNIGEEYVYTMQPALEVEDPDYTMCISRQGRPYDELFDPISGEEYGYSAFMDYSDRVNARRGFMWNGGYRGNWYLHYKTGSAFIMDEMAPMIHGTVKVVRHDDLTYTLTWDLEDDVEVPNKITGTWTGRIFR